MKTDYKFKPQELRIGVQVQYNAIEDRKLLVHTLDINDILQCDIIPNMYSRTHQPIPITAEVLEGCNGFSKNATNKNFWTYKFNPFSTIDISPTVNSVWLNDLNLSGKIQYLHQLQNLIYALTGEEIIYTL